MPEKKKNAKIQAGVILPVGDLIIMLFYEVSKIFIKTEIHVDRGPSLSTITLFKCSESCTITAI